MSLIEDQIPTKNYQIISDVKDELRTLYFILPTLKTADVNKQNRRRRKPSF